MFCAFHNSKEVKKAREAIQKREVGSILSLMDLPKNFKPEYEHQVTSYRPIGTAE
jgi:hypothetical protein